MNRLLVKRLKEDRSWKEETLRGLPLGATSAPSSDVANFLSRVFQSSSEALPPYIRWHRGRTVLKASEEAKILMKQASSNAYETAPSCVQLYGIELEYTHPDGRKEIVGPRYIQIPYINNRRLMLSGTSYQVLPSYIDKMLSPDGSGLLTAFVRDRSIVRREMVIVKVDGILKMSRIPYSDIYRAAKKITVASRTKTTWPHYLFAGHGLKGTFDKYLGIKDVVVSPKPIRSNKYTVVSSNKGKEIFIGVPKEQFNDIVLKYMAALVYLVESKYLEINLLDHDLEDVNLWRIAMGQILFGTVNYGNPKLLEMLNQHIETIESYIDPMVLFQYENQFGDYLPPISDIWDLFTLIIDQIDYWLANKNLPMFDKIIDWKYLLLYELITTFNLLVVYLKRNSQSRRVTFQEVQSQLAMKMTTGRVFRIVSQEMTLVDSTVPDHSFLGGDYLHIPTNGPNQSKSDLPPSHPSLNLSAEYLKGSPTGISKARPSPLMIINPSYGHLPTGELVIPEDVKRDIERIKLQFRK